MPGPWDGARRVFENEADQFFTALPEECRRLVHSGSKLPFAQSRATYEWRSPWEWIMPGELVEMADDYWNEQDPEGALFNLWWALKEVLSMSEEIVRGRMAMDSLR